MSSLLALVAPSVNSEFCRRDFLEVPESWKGHALHAYVEPSISADHQVVDHLAVVCHGQVHMAVDPTRQPRQRLRIDQKQLFDPANRALVQGIVASIPDIPWSISVHEHCSILTSHLQSQLSLHFPPPKQGMRADYFGGDTVALHRTLCGLRNDYHRQCHALKLARLRCAVFQWREQRPDMGLLERLQGRWMGDMHMGIALRAGRVRSAAVQLRRQCKYDKARYLHKLAEDVDSSCPRDVHSRCSGSRGVLAQNALAKVAQRATRCLLIDHLDGVGNDLRIGGRHGYCAGYGSLLVRCFTKFAVGEGKTPGTVFVDITAAYYCVIRELVSGTGSGDGAIEELVSSLGLSAEDLQALQAYSRQDPVLGSLDPPILHALAGEFHSHTWQVLCNDVHITATRKGSQPGSAWADAIFAALFEKVLQRREGGFQAAVRPEFPWDERMSLDPPVPRCEAKAFVKASDVTYADDLALLTVARCTAMIGVAVAEITSVAVDSFSNHGFVANFAKGKTAAMISPCRPGARETRRKLFVEAKGKIPVLREAHAPAMLELVPSYRHLGTVVHHQCSMHPEVLRRVALTRVAFREGRRAIYLNPHIHLLRRSALFRVNVLSALLYGSGTWAGLLSGTFRLLAGAVHRLYRQLVRIRHDASQHWSSRQIEVAVQLPRPQTLLHVERLRFLCMLLRTGHLRYGRPFAMMGSTLRLFGLPLDGFSLLLPAPARFHRPRP